jgi:tRNA threonylcarbamoyladenosine biosynthesis protein TsaE
MLSASAGKDRSGPRQDNAGAAVLSMITRSSEETFALGKTIGASAAPGTVLCLFGDLGSGKTKLTQGIAAGLSVPGTYAVTSPTFTYVNEYPGRLPLYHIDLYRISSPEELADLGWEEYIWSEGVVAVEWAERAGGYLPEKRIEIAITTTGADERRFDITFVGDHKTIYTALISRTHKR